MASVPTRPTPDTPPAESVAQRFPRLAGGNYRITSLWDRDYNCIAWAVGDTLNWWWPGADVENEYWPPGVPRARTLDAFRQMFATLGYVVCAGEELEPGVEKVAI